ncbi:MAG: hypothetical protein ACXWKH_17935, partial [Limisphaerales bacterium]
HFKHTRFHDLELSLSAQPSENLVLPVALFSPSFVNRCSFFAGKDNVARPASRNNQRNIIECGVPPEQIALLRHPVVLGRFL